MRLPETTLIPLFAESALFNETEYGVLADAAVCVVVSQKEPQ
jgi:hypothetical protein